MRALCTVRQAAARGLVRLRHLARLRRRAETAALVAELGAGGGLELKTFADAQSGWSFDGIDPSANMLRLAAETIGEQASRIRLHEGYIDTAPEGPFDGATSLLTFHFIPRERRLETLRQ